MRVGLGALGCDSRPFTLNESSRDSVIVIEFPIIPLESTGRLVETGEEANMRLRDWFSKRQSGMEVSWHT